MIPLRDDIPSRRAPVVTYALIAANVLAFAYEVHLGRASGRFLEAFGLVPSRFHGGHGIAARFLPVYSSMFLHGGLMHLAGNMLFLHIFGDNVEDRLGHGRFLLFYLGCGTIAAVVQVAMLAHSSLPMVGASGAIAGVTGAYFVFYPRARVQTVVPVLLFYQLVWVPALLFLLLWFVMQLLFAMMTLGAPAAGGVAWWAHVGGFAGGAIGGPMLAQRR
jgi:rhomboid family protein